MATALSVVATVVGIASTVKQSKEAKKARKEQERANQIQNKQAARARQRRIRQSLAESRIQRARAISAGFSAGVSGSSSVAGAVGGITSDAASVVGASGVQFGAETARVGALQSSNLATSEATQSGALAGAAFNLAQVATPQNIAALQARF